jgi:hypothetical protein
MKILVCGGRDYSDKELIFKTLYDLCIKHSKFYNPDDNWLPSDIKIIAGGAAGADRIAISFAIQHYTQYKEYPAQWQKYGRAAGPMRNQQMLDKEHPDLVVAFPGGRGTTDMISRAKKAGIKVMEIEND